MSPTRNYDDPHPVFLTLALEPAKGQEIVLELQGREIPSADYRLLRDCLSGELCIYKPDAVWGDCCTAVVRVREKAIAA